MKTKIALLALALGASTCLVSAQDGPPPADTQTPPQHDGGPGGPGDFGRERGGPGGQRGFHLLPPRAQEVLKLTEEQSKQIAALEAETKAKLEKILTADQLEQLKNLRPPMRGGAGGPPMRGGPKGQGGPDQGPGNDGNPPPAGGPAGDK